MLRKELNNSEAGLQFQLPSAVLLSRQKTLGVCFCERRRKMSELVEKITELRSFIAELVNDNRLQLRDAMALFEKIERLFQPFIQELEDGLQTKE
jgi:hypothetical protein